MSVDAGAAGQGQAPAGGQQQGQAPAAQGQQAAGEQGTGQAPGAGSAGGQGQSPIDLSTVQDPAVRAVLERQQTELAEARREAARYRTERQTLAQQVEEYKRQNETDAERAAREQSERDAEREQLRAENRALKVGKAVVVAATAAKAFNPDRVAALLDGQVELDEKGNPTNVADLLAQLQQSDPYLFQRAAAGADAGAGQGGAGGAARVGGINDLIRRGGRSVSRA